MQTTCFSIEGLEYKLRNEEPKRKGSNSVREMHLKKNLNGGQPEKQEKAVVNLLQQNNNI